MDYCSPSTFFSKLDSLRTTTSIILSPIIYLRKISMMRTVSKHISSTSSTKNLKTSTNAGSSLWQNVGDKSEVVLQHTLSKENCVLVVKRLKFLLKTQNRNSMYSRDPFQRTSRTMKYDVTIVFSLYFTCNYIKLRNSCFCSLELFIAFEIE